MGLSNVEVPLYDGSGIRNEEHKLVVNEFLGKCYLRIENAKKNTKVEVICYWEDLKRAWEAVKE